jgi:putative membrane protein
VSAPDGEPDYRFTLANERTFLAWQRTALGLLAAAVAAVQLLPDAPLPWGRYVLGGVLAILAMLTAVTGLRRWSNAERAIRAGEPLPRSNALAVLAVGLVVLGVITLVLVAMSLAAR